MFTITTTFSAIATIAAAVALLLHFRNRGTEKAKIARDLYLHYHSEQMFKSRIAAREWLSTFNGNGDQPFAFTYPVEDDYPTLGELERMALRGEKVDEYAHLNRVLTFWLLCEVMIEKGQVDKILLRTLLSDEHNLWRLTAGRLCAATSSAIERHNKQSFDQALHELPKSLLSLHFLYSSNLK